MQELKTQLNIKTLKHWIMVAIVAILVGTLLEFIGLPGAHFFGGVITGLVLVFFQQKSQPVPDIIFKGSLALTGVVIGTFFVLSTVTNIVNEFVPIIIISLATLVVSLVLGFSFAKVTGIDLATSLLGMLAGGSAMNVVTSEDIKADVRIVTFMHLVRLMLVLISTPIVLHFLSHSEVINKISNVSEINSPFFLSLIFTILVTIIGLWLSDKIKYEGSDILTPLFLSAILISIPIFSTIIPPEGFREFAAMIIGLQVGMRFDRDVLNIAKKHFLSILLFMFLVIVACMLFAWFLASATSMNAVTAYLSTTPGGRTAVIALAFTKGANPSTVLAVQTLRLLIMTLLGPLCIKLICKYRKQ